jgi:hypothetical protein
MTVGPRTVARSSTFALMVAGQSGDRFFVDALTANHVRFVSDSRDRSALNRRRRFDRSRVDGLSRSSIVEVLVR